MSTPLSILSRLEALERRLDERDQTIRALLGRLAAAPAPREIFLAQAIAGEDTGGPLTFPKTGNTFNFRLLDRPFTPAPGTQSTDDVPRTPQQLAAARTIDGRWVYENDFVGVVHTPQPPGTAGDKGEWWILDPRRIEIVKKTSSERDETSGYYPGKLMYFDPVLHQLTEVANIWIEDMNEV